MRGTIARQAINIQVAIPDGDACPRVQNADLGMAIRSLRKARHLTIEALALDAETHPTYLSGIERGIRNPTWDKLTRLAQTLKVPVSVIVLAAEDCCMEKTIHTTVADAYHEATAPIRSRTRSKSLLCQ